MDASQIHVNADDLTEFAQQLARFADRITEYDQKLAGGLSRLGQTCRDRDFEALNEHFQKSRQLLQKFVEEAKKTVPKLNSDAEIIRQYKAVSIPEK